MKLFASTLLLASAVSAVDTDASLDDQIALNAEVRRKAMFSRAYSMDKAEAMEKVSKKDSSMKSQISMVLGAKKLEKDTAKRAVQTLNDMYLEAEKELDEKVFGCMVERTNMKKAMEMTEVELQENAAASDDSSKSKKEAEDTRDSADNEVSNLDSELDTLQKDYDFVKAEDEKELGELEANLAVMSFILEIAQCKAPALMLGQKNAISAEVMSCQKQNADNGMYLVNMFSNPELRRRVESELSLSQQKKLQDILGEATAEKAMDKQMDKEEQEAEEGVAPNTDSNTADSSDSSSSFVQVASQQPQEDFKTCSSMEPDCAMMTDKVGGMYGDAKDAVDNKTFEMDQKAKAFERQKDDIIEQREGLLNEKNMAMQEISTQSEELGTLSAGRESTEERQREQKREFNRMWDGCKKEINKIMFDGVCAVLNVRKNVLDAAKTVLSVKPDELQDCTMTEWHPVGSCSHKCVERKSMPTDDVWQSLVSRHQQKWEREPITSPPEDDELALPCPQTMENLSVCNEFLCPVNCELSAFAGWSTCTKKCGGGTRSKTRSIEQRSLHGGNKCDSLTETEPCHTFSCDVDCEVARRPKAWGPCVRGCLDSTDKMIGSRRSIPFKIGVKPVVVKAKGKGKCPKKYSNLRVKRKNCNKRRCRLDEVCVDRMDIVFAVDGSGSLGENGFETFKNFTSELASKMMPKYFTWPAVKVGAVVFGNGGLVKQKVNGVEKTMIRPAKLLTPGGPISDMKKVVKIIEEAKWQKGFVNMGQGILAACNMLQRRGRKWANRKIVVISDGQPTLTFATSQAATECKDKNVVIDFIVVNSAFDKDNAAWDDFKRLPSYPWNAHTHHIKGMNQLLMKPSMLASRLLPRICPKARSVSRLIKRSARKGYIMVHRGRDCGNWWVYLGRFQNVRNCARAADRRQYKSFVFQFHKLLRTRNRRYYCWTHKVMGKKDPFVDGNPFVASEGSCTCTNRYCTGKVKGGKQGWNNQRVLKYTGYSHYAVVNNANKFIKAAKEAVNAFKPLAFVAVEDKEVSEKSVTLKEAESLADEGTRESDQDEHDVTPDDVRSEVMKMVAERLGN